MNSKYFRSDRKSNRNLAFTLIELGVVLGVLILSVAMLLPALGRTLNNSAAAQCRNNLKQLAAAWSMYSGDNQGRLVSAYPNVFGFPGAWCRGNAAGSGGPEVYVYGGTDPAGITNGLLWPYVRNLNTYKCALDRRVVTSTTSNYLGKPILRSVAMNAFMAGQSYGLSTSWSASMGGTRNPQFPVLLKESEISRPSQIWVILEEDPQSINDGMFTVNMGQTVTTYGFIDLPSRLHNNGYGINFADGHVAEMKLKEVSSLLWTAATLGPTNEDWRTVTSMTTNPLQ